MPPLRIAGLQRLGGLSNLSDPRTGNPLFSNATAFRQGSGAWQVLLESGGAADLEVARLDGSGLRHVAMNQHCAGPAAITPDGQWVACLSYSAQSVENELEIGSLSESGPERHWAITLDAATSYHQLAWSPVGKYLALAAAGGAIGCGIQVYAITQGYTKVTLLTTLTSAVFLKQGYCSIDGLGWSSDGARLFAATVAPYPPTSLLVDETTPIAQLIQTGTSAATRPAKAFVTLNGQRASHLAWNPRDDRLAFSVDFAASGVMLAPAGASQASVAFTWPSAPGQEGLSQGYMVYGMSWMPDGAGLLLTISGIRCVDCGSVPLPDVYLYSPGSTG